MPVVVGNIRRLVRASRATTISGRFRIVDESFSGGVVSSDIDERVVAALSLMITPC